MIEEISTIELRSSMSIHLNSVAFGKNELIISRRGKRLVKIVPLDHGESPCEGGPTYSELSYWHKGLDSGAQLLLSRIKEFPGIDFDALCEFVGEEYKDEL